MAYSDFTLEKAAAVLGITTQEADLFPKLVPLLISNTESLSTILVKLNSTIQGIFLRYQQ